MENCRLILDFQIMLMTLIENQNAGLSGCREDKFSQDVMMMTRH
jgi:hypothetical protein